MTARAPTPTTVSLARRADLGRLRREARSVALAAGLDGRRQDHVVRLAGGLGRDVIADGGGRLELAPAVDGTAIELCATTAARPGAPATAVSVRIEVGDACATDAAPGRELPLLADVAHEIRTPLASIVNLTRLLLSRVDGELSTGQETQIRFLERAGVGLSDLVDDLLDLSRLDGGRLRPAPERFTIAALFAALEALPLLGPLDPVALRLEPPAEPIEVTTDRHRLGRVVRQLIWNAVKHARGGRIDVRARAVGDDVEIDVTDDGPGVPPGDRRAIFQPPAAAGPADGAAARGPSGLGLPIARQLARALGGSLEVSQAAGRGARFVLRVPRVLPAAGASPIDDEAVG